MMSDTFDEDYGDEAGIGFEGPTPEQIANVVALAQTQVKIETWLVEMGKRIEQAKETLRQISEQNLPTALLDAGLKSFTLADGSKVAIHDTVVGYIRKPDEPVFHDWLEETGRDGIIKRTLTLQFGKDEATLANEVVRRLRNWRRIENRPVIDNRSVHHQTLQAFIREAHANGVELPDVVNVTELRKTVITRNKIGTDL